MLGEVEGENFAYCFWAASGCVIIVALVSLPLRDGGRLNCGAKIGCCGPSPAESTISGSSHGLVKVLAKLVRCGEDIEVRETKEGIRQP
eukprot:SAG31_NODE_1045_length_10180_cov_5.454221_2_plen_89_part_00